MRERKTKLAGQGLVEFALILPIILLFIMGIIDFGRIIFVYNQVSSAAREAVRIGVVNPTDCTSMRNTASQSLLLINPPVTVTIQYDNGQTVIGGCPPNGSIPNPMPPGARLRVHVLTRVTPYTPIINNIIPVVPIGYAAARTVRTVGAEPPPPPGPTRTPEPATQTPTPAPAVVVTFVSGYPYRVGGSGNRAVYAMVYVTAGGAPAAGATVIFNLNGLDYTTTANANGYACLQLGTSKNYGETVNVIATYPDYNNGYTTGTTANGGTGACAAPTPTPTVSPTATSTPTRTPSPTPTPPDKPNTPNLNMPTVNCIPPHSVSLSWSIVTPPNPTQYRVYRTVDGAMVWSGTSLSCSNCDAGFPAISASGTFYYVIAVGPAPNYTLSDPSNMQWAQCMPTPTNTPIPTNTSTPTNTPTRTPTITPGGPTFTPTPTNTPTRTPTNTPSGPTNTPTRTPTPSRTPTVTPTPCLPLAAPTLSGSRSGNTVDLSWTAVTGAQEYNVYRSVDNGPFQYLDSETATSASYNSQPFVVSYYVVAVDACGTEGPASNIVVANK